MVWMPGRVCLVVEDDAIIRNAIGRAMGSLVEPRFAENGEQALEQLATPVLPQFVLLDFLLPDCTGLDIVESMRADPRLHDVPVIIFSSLDAPERRQQALAAGANDWVAKPDEPAHLVKTVQQLCQRWGSRS
jgi:CheY-like chemotaxis protein